MAVLGDVGTTDVLGVAGLVFSALIGGWFTLRAGRQKNSAQSTEADVRGLGTDVGQALALASELVAVGKAKDDALAAKDETIEQLRARLDDCLRSRPGP